MTTKANTKTNKSVALSKLKEDIVFEETLCGQTLTFHSTWGIFSPKSIDKGSIMILDYLDIEPHFDCLDLGCGYGPIGLTMARLANKGETTMVDKDFMAIEYSKKNAATNNINNCDIKLSNGLQHIRDKRFHCIASNVPAKVGSEMMTIMLNITGLRRYIERNFKDIFGNYKKLKQGKQYTVAMARKPA